MNQTEGHQDNALQYFEDVANIVRQTLQMSEDTPLEMTTPLLGAIAEFDSMSVITVLTVMEEDFGFVVDDEDVSAETFATLGSLVQFVQDKLDG